MFTEFQRDRRGRRRGRR